MPYRARHRRRRPVALIAPPVAVAAAASLSLAGAQAQLPSHEPQKVADVQELGPAAPEQPFSATPIESRIVGDPLPTSAPHRHTKRPVASGPIVALPTHLNVTASTIPRRVLAAYVNATNVADKTDPGCDLQWQTLAGIGFIESDHARSGGSEDPHWNGIANPPILGPILDGKGGVGRIADTDHGLLDGNKQWDRAVGPMQFIPSTWARWAADGNHDGIEDPQNIDDATLAAANYLCASGPGLNERKVRIKAIYSYNHSYSYVRAVLTVAAHYAGIDPAKLGIDGLPKDAKHKHGKRAGKTKHHGKHGRRGQVATTTTTPTAVPTTPTTASPTPTSSPTPRPTSSPSPTATETSTTPTPETTPSVHVPVH